ncbi:bacterio-opsin activator domain-containing protein [Halobellus sp. GM3]|uniref:bacterio-opsin activator domain-containing protein n=1 Tax=Halobellus sp. GM3 TaxID=3458410 RepID=UPI00403E1539
MSPVVLVVDDDRDLADTCEYWLRDDFDVRVAYGGEAALDRMSDDVDVVLLDRRMPDLSGDEVLEAIHARGYDCRVAMMTAVDPDTDIVEMPFDEYLVKPVDEESVRGTVEELLVRSEFDEQVREYFALESTEAALDSRDVGDLGDPDALRALTERLQDLRAKRESEIRERERQLTRVRRINALLRDVDSAIVDASTREDIETTVCEAFAASPYEGAWIARYDGTLDAVEWRVDGEPSEPVSHAAANAARDAVETGSVCVAGPREAAAESNGDAGGDAVPRVVAAPITYGDTTYGALVVAVRGSLSREERSVFGEIGRTVGNGINGAESKRLLYGDSAVELRFDHADTRDLVVDLSLEFETTVRLEGFSPAGDGVVSCYLAVNEVDAAELLSTIAPLDALADARVVSERDGESLFELRLRDASVLVTLAELGATVETFTASGGEGTLVVRVPSGSDLRALTEAVQSSYPDLSIRAKREIDDAVQSTSSFRRQLAEKLTDRQRTVMETALVSGYFEWPRGSTAEEVADSLGIAAPTFHEHLRAGERKLIESFFAETEHAVTVETVGSETDRGAEDAVGND